MASKEFINERKDIQKLFSIQVFCDLCKFGNVLFFHSDHPFNIRGKNLCSI